MNLVFVGLIAIFIIFQLVSVHFSDNLDIFFSPVVDGNTNFMVYEYCLQPERQWSYIASCSQRIIKDRITSATGSSWQP